MQDVDTIESRSEEERYMAYGESGMNRMEEQQEQEPRKKKSKKFGFLLELLVYAVIIVLCITVVPRYVIQRTQVDGISMKNTLHNEESLLVEKVTYRFKDPERFDIITFYPNGRDEEEYYIKRVIGLPGEKIQISGDTIYINGEVLEEDYGRQPMEEEGIAAEPILLGADEFFVLGDNRNESIDSRSEEVGVVKRENIDGHAILRIYPLSAFGTIQNKNSKE